VTARDRAKDLFLAAALEADGDAPRLWVVVDAVGGSVCGVCREPVESEPCQAHQPAAWARMEAER
jgi:hypothetical protein